MNIAIIGCGYVGYAVAQYWQQKMTFLVTATTTTPERVPMLEAVAQKVVVVQGDDPEKLKSVLQNKDTVLLSVAPKERKFYQETYLDTAKNVVKVLQDVPSVKQLIYTGSYSVYGDQDGAWVDETMPVVPNYANGEILKATEEVLLTASSKNLRVCILRLGGIYGPNRELVKIFGAAPGTTRPGNGEDITNWIHLDDIVGAIDFVRQHHLQGIYNLVDDAHLSNKELLNTLFEKHNLSQVSWDSSIKNHRPYNAKVSNQKIKDAGYKLIHPQILF